MMEPVNISICNQKGGIGKSTFTVLLASYLHYTLGHDILVVTATIPNGRSTPSANANWRSWSIVTTTS